jgi:hypothetical protein
LLHAVAKNPEGVRKDQSLDALARQWNVAQFISFAPDPSGRLVQTFSRVQGFVPNHVFPSLKDAISQLFLQSSEGTINLRSFAPDNPRSREFVYAIQDIQTAVSEAIRLASQGLFVIANETVDVNDGGVSGVLHGDIIEFAPGDTPRCVEKPGVASLPRSWGLKLLTTVYGFTPEMDDAADGRLEFSVHPKPRGWKSSHTLVWEYEQITSPRQALTISWPNRFSRHLGDKAFGLLVAHEIGLPVPRTIVFGRHVAPFTFGLETESHEVWIRTCPSDPDPGRFTTRKGWVDPFELLAREDAKGSTIAAVLCQAAIPAKFSGATIVTIDGKLEVEGRAGEGDALMLGKQQPEPLPDEILHDVSAAHQRLNRSLGPVRFEWVHDGKRAWIVQLHCGATESSGSTLVPGQPEYWVEFEIEKGIDALRRCLSHLPLDVGVTLIGSMGLTSHLADLVRKSKRPAKIISPAT